MANSILLTSDVPVVAPGTTLNLTAKVFNSETGVGAQGMTVKWTIIGPEHTTATLGSATSLTSATGFASNTLDCEIKGGVIVQASVDDADKDTKSLQVGFYSDDLSAPIVPQAKNGILTEKEVNGTVQAMVLRHTDDPVAGDLYNFYWGKNAISRFDDGTSDTFPWIINIKNDFSATEVLSDGDYTVYYTITDLAQNITYSQPLAITVTGGTYINPLYDAPEFSDISNNTINYDDVDPETGVTAYVILPQSSDDAVIYANNIITLYMRVFDKNYKTEIIPSKAISTHTVTDDEISDKKIPLEIPKDAIMDSKDTFDDVRGQFWYTVTGTGSVAVAGSSFTKTVIIDTVPPHLPKA
ncbi:hypothetical protein ACLEEB_05530 [Lonsdalea quercina]|uniref:Big-1 domain-containing protein n=1 Tax=Lonsdalea quercina TaxID=71657 RepID=A0A1H3ZGD7_9GAMM|nr:hypothetical protein [Lonsdalea quercina]SEA22695.1 hypothetical protein SAMN02982996_01175 [Lonsdalea quercina]